MKTYNPLTESLTNLLLDTPFGVNFQAEEGSTQKQFGKNIRLHMANPGVIVMCGDNGRAQICEIVNTEYNGYVQVESCNTKFHLFSQRLGNYLHNN